MWFLHKISTLWLALDVATQQGSHTANTPSFCQQAFFQQKLT
jgi:hypothetical protein